MIVSGSTEKPGYYCPKTYLPTDCDYKYPDIDRVMAGEYKDIDVAPELHHDHIKVGDYAYDLKYWSYHGFGDPIILHAACGKLLLKEGSRSILLMPKVID